MPITPENEERYPGNGNSPSWRNRFTGIRLRMRNMDELVRKSRKGSPFKSLRRVAPYASSNEYTSMPLRSFGSM